MQETAEERVITDPSYSQKLTDWANEPSLETLKKDLDDALPSHNALMQKIENWNDLLFVKGKYKPKKVPGRSTVQPKLARRQAEWRYPALSEPFLAAQNLLQIRPKTFEDGEGARQNALVVNHQIRTKINRVKFIDDLVRGTVDEGTACVRTGWIRQTRMVRKEVPTYSFYAIEDPEQLELLSQAIDMKNANPRQFEEEAEESLKEAVTYYEETGQAAYAEVTGSEFVEVEEVIENRPDLKIFDPRNVVVDPSCEGDLTKAMFCVFFIETSKAEIMKDKGRYKNLDKVDWENAGPMTDTNKARQTPDNFQFRDAMRKRVIAYEYWGFYDINGDDTLVPFVATWIGNTLVRMELNPFAHQKLPLVMIPYLPIKREIHGETDAELLEDNQNILGAISRGMIDLLGRSANSQQGFAKGMLDPLNKRRFENGQDYEFNPNVPVQNGHIQHKYPELPQSALILLNLQNQEAEALTGVKAFSGGLSGDAFGDVAAGVRGMLDAASKREMSILRRIAYGIAEIGRHLVSMNQEFLSEEETIRITNTQFVQIRREDLAGEFDYEVDITTPEIEDAQAKDLAFMLQTTGPNMGLGLMQKILAKIAELKRMPDLAEEIRSYQPQPDPVAEALQRLEVAEIEAKIAEIQSKTALNYSKAEEAKSKSDLNNLDFVEQETGTKHAREIDKQGAQARGNQDLQITKALTTPQKEGERPGNVPAAIGYNNITDMRDEAGTL